MSLPENVNNEKQLSDNIPYRDFAKSVRGCEALWESPIMDLYKICFIMKIEISQQRLLKIFHID
jgi:hypothetical protein